MRPSSFSVHPTLDDTLTAVDEDELPADIDASPAGTTTHMSSTELCAKFR